MRLDNLFDVELLDRHVADGMVAVRRHPSEPLRIFNYTAACQWAQQWDDVTRQCRGLIVDDDNYVVARPFPKFFNLDEHGPDTTVGPLALIPPLRVQAKLDGSLGLSFWAPNAERVEWATRGSFESEQAQFANAWWQARHGDRVPPPGVTWLTEIIHPGNRIVVDYGDKRDLTLLDAIDIETGLSMWRADAAGWPGPVVEDFQPVVDPRELDPETQDEGFVVTSSDRKTRVKLKSASYVALHRIVFGFNSRSVWELLMQGEPVEDIVRSVPEESAAWCRGVAEKLMADFDRRHREVTMEFNLRKHLLFDRKQFAEAVKLLDDRALLFSLADGKPIAEQLWKQLKPAAEPMALDAAA